MLEAEWYQGALNDILKEGKKQGDRKKKKVDGMLLEEILSRSNMIAAYDRVVGNKWIGQRMSDPDIDLAMVARAQGAVGIGPVQQLGELKAALAEAVAALKDGNVVVVDARVAPGYDPNTARAMTLEAAPPISAAQS